MYEDEPTFDALAAIEDMEMMRAHSPTFWDTDAAELAHGHDPADPWNHPSVDVEAALADGWDDPAEAAGLLEQTTTGIGALADTPRLGGWRVYPADELWADAPTPEESLHEQVLALVPVDGAGLWPAADYAERGAAA